MAEWQQFWILPADGDPLPWCGFRNVRVMLGRKWVRIRAQFDTQSTRIKRDVWERDVPHVENTRQPMADALAALRSYQPVKPCKGKECNI